MNILWSTQPDQDGNYQFIKTIKNKSEPVVLRGVSLCGLEYPSQNKDDATNIILSFFDPDDPTTHTILNFTIIVKNIIDVLCDEWGANLIRVPICLSAYSETIQIYFQGDKKSYSYPYLIKIVISAILNRQRVALVDGHLWATDPATSKMAYSQYCSFDFKNNRPTNTQNYGIQLYALQDLMDMPTGKPIPNVVTAWGTIISDTTRSFNNNQNLWFEFINEPFYRPFTAEDSAYASNRAKYKNWKNFFHTLIKNARTMAPTNILVVNGMDRGYDFFDAIQELSDIPYRSLRTLFGNDNKNIAYGVHPFQIAACCGLITGPGEDPNVIDTIRRIYIPYKNTETSTLLTGDPPYQFDQSVFDPYEKVYCHFPGKISNRNIYQDNMKGKPFSIPSPSGNYYFDLPAANQNTELATLKCDHSFNKSQSKKLPPCQFDEGLMDARTGTQFVGTYIGDCPPNVIRSLQSKTFNIPSSGWNKYFLGMRKYGPIVATAFGTFDCSLPYLTAFLEYAEMNSLSWVAFGIQSYLPYRMYKNNLNPCNMSCLTISSISPAGNQPKVQSVLPTKKKIGNYMECLKRKNCSHVLTPIGNKNGYGDTIQKYLQLNIKKEETLPPRPSPPKPKTTTPETTTTAPETTTTAPETTTTAPETTTTAPETTTTMIPKRNVSYIGYIIVPIIILLALLFRYRNRIRNFFYQFLPQTPETRIQQIQLVRQRINLSSGARDI